MSRSIATSSGYLRLFGVFLALLTMSFLSAAPSVAAEPGEETPPVITNGVISPSSLPSEGGTVTIAADVLDEDGVASVYVEMIGTDGNFQAATLLPTEGATYSAEVNIPANFAEWPVSYTVEVWAADANETYSSLFIGEIQVEPQPQFDEPPDIWEPSVTPYQLPAAGGPVAIRALAFDTRAISEVYAVVTSPDGSTAQVPMEPVSSIAYEGVFTAPPNTGTGIEKYTIEAVALDDIGQPASVDAGRFLVVPPFQPSCLSGSPIGGGGSLPQMPAQQVWAKAFATEVCPGLAEPRYSHIAGGHATDFLATEAAPSPAEIDDLIGEEGAGLAVIPVAQTAIAIIARPPSGCTIDKITNRQLERVFRGTLERWEDLATASGPRCTAPVKRVVPRIGVGITTQLKSYLARMNHAELPCVGKTWLELREFGDGKAGAPNVTWPEGCDGTTEIIRPAGSGGVGVVNAVNRTRGSIGFAGLPEAKLGGANSILRLQNNGQLNPETAIMSYASPEAGGRANCGRSRYDVPLEARRRPGSSGLNADWSEVVGALPAIGADNYPLCMLTYDLAFHGYQSRPGSKPSFRRAQTVRDYMQFIVRPEGQAFLAKPGSFYAPLPTAPYSSEDVLAAAQYAAGKVRY